MKKDIKKEYFRKEDVWSGGLRNVGVEEDGKDQLERNENK